MGTPSDLLMQVVCPAGVATGGPEALHQLVATATKEGLDAEIVYVGPHDGEPTHERFRHYEAPVGTRIVDEPGVLVVYPETMAHGLFSLDRAAGGLWWLSVDFFDRDNAAAQSALGTPAKPYDVLYTMPRVLHLVQSEYAAQEAAARGVGSVPLTDYFDTSLRARLHGAAKTTRRPAIAYNPAKGFEQTRRVMELAPDLQWVALTGMTPAEIARTLGEVTVYLDLGEHPGRDRIPREAVLAGACLVVARRGSAANDVDVPLDPHYKVDLSDPDAPERVVTLLREVLADPVNCQRTLTSYQDWVDDHESVFAREVRGVYQAAADLPAPVDVRWLS